MKRQHIGVIILIISVVAFLFLVLPQINAVLLFDSLKTTDPVIYCIALITLTISNIVASVRWSRILKTIKVQNASRLFNAIFHFCFGQLAGLIVPSRVGNYTKVPLIKKTDDVPYDQGLAAVNAETVLDLVYISCAGIVSIFLLSVFFSLHPLYSIILVITIIILMFGSIITLYNINSMQETFKWIDVLSRDKARAGLVRAPVFILSKIIGLIRSTREIFTTQQIVAELGAYTLITQAFGVLGLFFILKSVHVSLPLLQVFAILSITYIIGIASFIPGGFGASDLSLIALLGYEGIPLPVATNVALLWRIAMYLPVLIIVGFYFLQMKFKDNSNPDAP